YQLALKFAAWLCPHFEVWVYGKILDLIQNGTTSLEEVPQSVQVKQQYVIHEAHRIICENLTELLEAGGTSNTIGNSLRTHAELVDVFGANRGFYKGAKLPSVKLAQTTTRCLRMIQLQMKKYKNDTTFQKLISGQVEQQTIMVLAE
ncbi:MAG: hypothetical protein ACPGXZ_06645, partial [Saprospiraceae bacterium]